jgi:hypothetical protein
MTGIKLFLVSGKNSAKNRERELLKKRPTNFLSWHHIELPHLTSACIGRMQRKGRTEL